MATQNERLELPNGMVAQRDPAHNAFRVIYAGGMHRAATIMAPLGPNGVWAIAIYQGREPHPVAEHSADSLDAAIDILQDDKQAVIASQNEARDNLRYQRESFEQAWVALVERVSGSPSAP